MEQKIIDITPVSSHTADSQPLPEPPGRVAQSARLLRARLIALAIFVALAAVVFVTVVIGAVVFLALLGLAAAAAVVLAVRNLMGKPPTSAVPSRRGDAR